MRSFTQGGIGECSTSAVKGFPDALGASTELADDDDYDKYVRHHAQHRSRSSPSRSRALEPPESPRQRSPSVSPDRRRHPNNSERAVSPCLFRSAYFSPRPPAAPLSLVLRRPLTPLEPYTPSPRPQKPQQTTQNHISRIPRSLESHRTPKSLRRSTQRKRGRRTVNLILRELVSTLPLPVKTTPSTAFNAPVSAAQAQDVRDVAVQAITTCKGDRNMRHLMCKDEGEEWVGGVRALRDSHVRLVLRQLRHIERLNRALDRATLAVSPPAALDVARAATEIR